MNHLKPLILLTLIAGWSLSCGTSKQQANTQIFEPATGQTTGVAPASEFERGRPAQQEADRKVLYSSFLVLTVDEPDSASRSIAAVAEKYGGYVNEIGTERTIIRVVSHRLDEAVNDIARLGKVQRKTLTGQDVTDEYLDYQIRLENAQKARDRYLELLAKAANVEEALLVERELERLNETIDLLKGRMQRISHLSEFATIAVDLRERKKPGVIGYVGLGLYHAVKWLFVRN